LLKIPRDQLDVDVNLADFGFDSISLAQFANLLSDYYGADITPDLFFGYPSLEKLAAYFMDNHHELIQAFYQEQTKQAPPTAPVPRAPVGRIAKTARKTRFTASGVHRDDTEPIAIIGMSGQFPQAASIDEMWEILLHGKDAVEEIPADRFDWRQYSGDRGLDIGRLTCKWGGFIKDVKAFDPLFFEISPREAEYMDPRQRLLLQESWKALESAGYGENQIKKSKIGMFVGAEEGDYQFVSKTGGITSNHSAILAARLAYYLDLKGPNMAINTACSS
jgi:acyl carrier protein